MSFEFGVYGLVVAGAGVDPFSHKCSVMTPK